ncbi:Protein of unknown function, partial [Gryllus bimaculatus]
STVTRHLRPTGVDNWSPHFSPSVDNTPLQKSTPIPRYPNDRWEEVSNADALHVNGDCARPSDDITYDVSAVLHARSSRPSRRSAEPSSHSSSNRNSSAHSLSEQENSALKSLSRRWAQLVNTEENHGPLDESCPQFLSMSSMEENVEEPSSTSAFTTARTRAHPPAPDTNETTCDESAACQGRSSRSSRRSAELPRNSTSHSLPGDESAASRKSLSRRWAQRVNTGESRDLLDESLPHFVSMSSTDETAEEPASAPEGGAGPRRLS